MLTTLNILLRLIVVCLIWPESLGGLIESPALLYSAVVLWNLGGTLDAADGTLARYRGQTSLFGRYYDKVSDRLITLCLILSLSARVYESTGQVLFVMLGMIYVGLMSATSVAKWIDLGLRQKMQDKGDMVSDPGEIPAPKRSLSEWGKFLVVSFSYIVVVTEMDLPLWGSLALICHREDLLLTYLGGFSIPYALYTFGRRGFLLHKREQMVRPTHSSSQR